MTLTPLVIFASILFVAYAPWSMIRTILLAWLLALPAAAILSAASYGLLQSSG